MAAKTIQRVKVREAVTIFREHGFIVSRRWVIDQCNNGSIPFVSLANAYWMLPDDVRQFIAKMELQSTRVTRITG